MRKQVLTVALLIGMSQQHAISCSDPIDINGYIVKSWSGDTLTTVQQAVSRIAIRNNTAAPSIQVVSQLGVGAYLIKFSGTTNSVNSVVASLAADPTLKYFTPNATMLNAPKQGTDTWPYYYNPNASYYGAYVSSFQYDDSWFSWTNDPSVFDQRWYAVESLGWPHVAAMGAVTDYTDQTTIAVLDTGYLDHPEFAGRILPGYDFISSSTHSNDGNGRDPDAHDAGDYHPGGQVNGCVILPQPSTWHGTQVASVALAAKGNGVGIVGFAPQARLLPVRVIGRSGATVADLADAIMWTAGAQVGSIPRNQNIPDVINMSLGHPGSCDPPVGEAINYAQSKGIQVVVAAGNSQTLTSNFTPASCYGVVAVGAATVGGGLAWFSNYGPGTTVVAPGQQIMTLTNTSSLTPTSNFDIVASDGTSFAAPIVSAAIARRMGIERVFRPAAFTPTRDISYLQSVVDWMFSESLPIECNGACGAGMINFSAPTAK